MREYLGGNIDTSSLTPFAIAEMLEKYAYKAYYKGYKEGSEQAANDIMNRI